MADSIAWSCPDCGGPMLVISNPNRYRAKRFGPVVKRHRRCRSCGVTKVFAEFQVYDNASMPLTSALISLGPLRRTTSSDRKAS